MPQGNEIFLHGPLLLAAMCQKSLFLSRMLIGFNFTALIMSLGVVLLAEMGNKTQLTTIALSVQFPPNPIWILAKAIPGMINADAVGIIVGARINKRIPERVVKYLPAITFVLFGFIGTCQLLVTRLKLDNISAYGIIVLLLF